eukprot:gene7638-7702_t
MNQYPNLSTAPKRGWFRGWPVWIIAAGILTLALLWVGVHFVLALTVETHARNFIEAEARHGRFWRCADVAPHGIPPSLFYSCTEAELSTDEHFTAQVAALELGWQILNPAHLELSATSPARLVLPNSPAADINWASLHLGIDGLSPLTARGTLRGTGLQLSTTAAPALFHLAESVVLAAGPMKPESDTLPVRLQASGLQSPLLKSTLRTDAPLAVDFDGEITQVGAFRDGFTPQNIDQWRRLAGTIHIASLHLAAADMTIGADGTLTLDGQHRLNGKLNLSVRGGEDLLSQYGYNTKKGLLGSMLGG